MGALSENVANLIRELCFFSRPQTGSKLLSADLLDPGIFDSIVDVIDDLLEHADFKLDEAAGIDISKRAYKLKDVVDKERVMYSNTLNIEKPQEDFDPPINNDRDQLFSPALFGKPNCTIPLERSINNTSHIYEPEISMINYELMPLEENMPREPFSFPVACNKHPFEYIETVAALRNLAKVLKQSNYSEIAVDLENHSYRSFQGFSCLMQVLKNIFYVYVHI